MSALKEFFGGFSEGFKKFGLLIGNILNYVLLAFVYLFGVGLTSIFAKLIGKHFLELRIDSEKRSYWVERKTTKQSLEDSKRQF